MLSHLSSLKVSATRYLAAKVTVVILKVLWKVSPPPKQDSETRKLDDNVKHYKVPFCVLNNFGNVNSVVDVSV